MHSSLSLWLHDTARYTLHNSIFSSPMSSPIGYGRNVPARNSKYYFFPSFEPSLYLVEKIGTGSFLVTLSIKSSVQTGICSVRRTCQITGKSSPSPSEDSDGSKCTPSYSSSYVAERRAHLCKTGPPDQEHTNSTGSASFGPLGHEGIIPSLKAVLVTGSSPSCFVA